jgi:hypothetical protein
MSNDTNHFGKLVKSAKESKNKETYEKFKKLVNMSASQINNFLVTDNSRRVGQKKNGDTESIGHQSGRHIIRILNKDKSELSDDDYAHMRKVCSYIARHTAQGGPTKDKETSPWRYSLMNWGRDPLKK